MYTHIDFFPIQYCSVKEGDGNNGKLGESWPPLGQRSTSCSLERSCVTILSISLQNKLKPMPEEEEVEKEQVSL